MEENCRSTCAAETGQTKIILIMCRKFGYLCCFSILEDLVMPYDVVLHFYAFMIEGARALAHIINEVLDFIPLQYLCILATRPRCAVVCTGNMYKVIDVFWLFFLYCTCI